MKILNRKNRKTSDLKQTVNVDEELQALLNAHPLIETSSNLSDRIMVSVQHSERIIHHKTTNAFAMKLANSLICTGILGLVVNMMTFKKNMFFTQGLQNGIISFNQVITELLDKLSQYQIFN